MTQPNRPNYHSYLLRCWAETDALSDFTVWRFSLIDPHTGQRRGFTSLTELVIILQGDLLGLLSEVEEHSSKQLNQ